MFNNSFAIISLQILHIIIIGYVVLTPFIGSQLLMNTHLVFVPGMMLHWYTNDNKCFLTNLENNLKRKNKINEEEEKGFANKIISRVFNYEIDDKSFDKFMYVFVSGLLSVSLYKILFKIFEN